MHTVAFYLLSALFVITPLVFSPYSSELFEFPKMLTVYLFAGFLVPFIVFTFVHRKKIHVPVSADALLVAAGVFLFLLSQLASSLFSIDKHVSLFGYYSRFNGGLLSLISFTIIGIALYLAVRKEHIIHLLRIILYTGVAVALWALPSKFGYDIICWLSSGSFSVSCWTNEFNPTERLFGTLGQPNWFAAYMLVPLFIALFLFFSGNQLIPKLKKQTNTILLMGILVLFTVELIWTKSRSALLSYVLIVPLLSTALFFEYKKHINKQSVAAATILLSAAVIFIAFQLTSLHLELNNLFSSKQKTIPSSKVSTSAISPSSQIRTVVWRGAWELGKKYPFLGTGVETFAYSYYFTRPIEHNKLSEWRHVYNKAHNELLNYLATTGVVGLTAYILMLLTFIFPAVRTIIKNENSTERGFYLTYIAIIGGIFITNFFGFSTSVSNLFLYSFPAIMLSMGIKSKEYEKLSRRSAFTIALSVLWGLLVTLYITNYFLADYNFARAKEHKQVDNSAQAYLYTQRALNLRFEPVFVDQQALLSAHIAVSLKLQKQTKTAQQFALSAVSLNAQTLSLSPYNIFYLKTAADINYLLSLAYTDETKKSAQYLKTAVSALKKIEQLAPTDPKAFYTHAALIQETDKAQSLKLVRHALQLKDDYEPSLKLYNQLLTTPR